MIRDYIDSESKEFPSDQPGCPEDNTTATKYTQPDLSDFLDNLWPEDHRSPLTQTMNPAPKHFTTVTTMTMHSMTQVSISTQTDICDFPPKKTVTHTGCNTTPKFVRDKTTQHAPTLISKGISPHCVFMDELAMGNWEQEASLPVTPDLGSPSYFTEEMKREEKGLPRCTVYQGPLDQSVPEDPLPPHISAEIPEWGVIQKNEQPMDFNLLDYMESLCQNITPPQNGY